MGTALHLEFHSRPSALRFMALAVLPSPGFHPSGSLPALSARWSGHRVDAQEYRQFLALCGLPETGRLPLLYPHVMSFPLQMSLLTHPRFPVPIWRVLQVRNRLLQLAPLEKDASFDLLVGVADRRILDKGAEIDLRVTVSTDGQVCWEGVNTFYVRGRFGSPQGAEAPPAPPVGESVVDQWQMPKGGGRRFGRLSGDYNGIHLWGGYARRLGFRHALLHPQRVLGQCLTRLPTLAPALPQRLDVWLKGPVYYGSQVTLRAKRDDAGSIFGLNMQDEFRPAIVGHLRPEALYQRLADATQ